MGVSSVYLPDWSKSWFRDLLWGSETSTSYGILKISKLSWTDQPMLVPLRFPSHLWRGWLGVQQCLRQSSFSSSAQGCPQLIAMPWSGLSAWPTDSNKVSPLQCLSLPKTSDEHQSWNSSRNVHTSIWPLGLLVKKAPKVEFQPSHAILRRYSDHWRWPVSKMSPHSDGKCPKQYSVSEAVHVHKGIQLW